MLVGPSVLGWVNPHHQTLQLLSELGVLILLFAIGLETDLSRLVKVGGTSMTVAVVGVAVPFLLGVVACRLLGMPDRVSIMAAATLTATSVGITARVLSDLGRLRDIEGQIILGAAVIDDILGLLILTVVTTPDHGTELSVGRVLVTTASAFGFLLAALVAGKAGRPGRLSTGPSDRAARHSNRARTDRRIRTGLAGRSLRLGHDHRGLRRRVARRGDAAVPRNRTGHHGTRPLLRSFVFRHGRRLG